MSAGLAKAGVVGLTKIVHNHPMVRDFAGTIIAEGEWKYDGAVRETIEIVAFDFDYWFEFPADDGRSEWKAYPLNDEGVLYYVRAAGDPLPKPFQSASEAKKWADAQPWGPIMWHAL